MAHSTNMGSEEEKKAEKEKSKGWRGGDKAKAEEKEAKELQDKAKNLKKELVLDQQYKIPPEELLARIQYWETSANTLPK